jgi:MtN3 and saliva related transmembrane protein
MKYAQLIGYAAGLFSSVGFMPQMIKGFMTKKVDDVAIWQPILLVVGMMLWLIYGIFLKDLPMILANVFSVACNSIVIVQKYLYKGNG